MTDEQVEQEYLARICCGEVPEDNIEDMREVLEGQFGIKTD